MTSLDRASQAFLAELHRQGKERGVTVEDNGELVQVDGSVEVRPLMLAVLASLESGAGVDSGAARIPGLYDARGSSISASFAAEAAQAAAEAATQTATNDHVTGGDGARGNAITASLATAAAKAATLRAADDTRDET